MRKYHFVKHKKRKLIKRTLLFPVNEKNDWISDEDSDFSDPNQIIIKPNEREETRYQVIGHCDL